MQSFAAAFEVFWTTAADQAWGVPLVVMLIGAGLFFTIYSRFVPLFRLPHTIDILRGKMGDEGEAGEISYFQALSSALAATIGMGNIAGVAIAVSMGGPGAVFWMWIAALAGMSTKFFTCTLATLYRKNDTKGVAQGGPMYTIEVGLGSEFRGLAVMFAVCGLVGCLGTFNANQLASLLHSNYRIPPLTTGVAELIIVGIVIIGGVVRVGKVTERIVPTMAVLYILASLVVIFRNIAAVPAMITTILTSAFSKSSIVGGSASVAWHRAMRIGVRRAAFSNEAGMGTAPMAMGATKTKEPVRAGLVAMLAPFIDTNVVCTMTAFVILSSTNIVAEDGLVMTTMAFEEALPGIGGHLLALIVLLFALSTMISYSYYSLKCAKYLFGERIGHYYIYIYLLTLPVAAVWSQDGVVSMLDTGFALMAVPNVFAALVLAPRVLAAARDYFSRFGTSTSSQGF